MQKRKSTQPWRATDIKHKMLGRRSNEHADLFNPAPTPEPDNSFIPGPKLRAKLGISAPTLWRWRHDEELGFPPPKVINGRLYFPLSAVTAWLAQRPDAA
jgi:predicted DNA-binding transcriptional regulator AlpA